MLGRNYSTRGNLAVFASERRPLKRGVPMGTLPPAAPPAHPPVLSGPQGGGTDPSSPNSADTVVGPLLCSSDRQRRSRRYTGSQNTLPLPRLLLGLPALLPPLSAPLLACCPAGPGLPRRGGGPSALPTSPRLRLLPFTGEPARDRPPPLDPPAAAASTRLAAAATSGCRRHFSSTSCLMGCKCSCPPSTCGKEKHGGRMMEHVSSTLQAGRHGMSRHEAASQTQHLPFHPALGIHGCQGTDRSGQQHPEQPNSNQDTGPPMRMSWQPYLHALQALDHSCRLLCSGQCEVHQGPSGVAACHPPVGHCTK